MQRSRGKHDKVDAAVRLHDSDTRFKHNNEMKKSDLADIGYICSLCGSSYNNPDDLEKHFNSHGSYATT